MRKLTLLLSFVVFAVFAFGQLPKVEKKRNLNMAEITKLNKIQPTDKAAGDIFWSEDFDSTDWKASVSPFDPATYSGNILISPDLMPAGWSVYDGNGEEYYWHWSILGPRGRYTSYIAPNLMTSLIPSTDAIDNLASVTHDNGFMVLEADYFNTLPNGTMNPNYKAMDSYIMTPAIDLSEASGVTLKWAQRFRWCCSSGNTLSVYVSNDYDPANPDAAHWAQYSAKGGVSVNDYQEDNPRIMEVDITPDAAGYSNVRLMWRMIGASHYVWMIDDIQLVEPFTNNLIVENTWADYMFMPPTGTGVVPDEDWFGGYTQMPRDIVSDFVQFRAAIRNFGVADQHAVTMNTKVTRNGNVVYNQSSTPIATVAAAGKDTCRILTPFTPGGMGQYEVLFNVTQTETDELPANNVDTFRFEVTDHTYSRVSHDPANYQSVSPGNWVGGDVEGARLAVLYDIPEGQDVTIHSLTTYIARRNDSALIAAGQFVIIGRLFGLDAEGNVLANPTASTEEYVLVDADRGNFLTLEFIDDGNLIIAPGSYYATFEFYTGTPAGTDHVDFYIAEDKSIPYPIYATNLFFDTDWGTIDANCFIDLNIVPTELPVSTVTFNVDMTYAIQYGTFNPASDNVDIMGSFNNNGNPVENLTAGANNIYSITKDIPKGEAVTFKFRINGTTAEPSILRDLNTTADTYTYSCYWDWAVGINHANVEKVRFYPNPVSDVLHISNLNNISKVEITNVLGQVVYNSKEVSSTMNISTKDMLKGVYFITVTDVNNVTRTERFIKK